MTHLSRHNICLSYKEQIHSFVEERALESYFWKYFFPPIFIVGILGNLAELYVLFSPGMRNRANTLLSALAFTDMTLLVLNVPHSLANFLPLDETFRRFYFYVKYEIVAFSNWSSAAAIWFVLTVCVDRLFGIKSPLYVCREWKPRKLGLLILGIVVGTGLLTSFHHFSYHCFYWDLCNGTQIHSKCFSVAAEKWRANETNPTPEWMRNYIRTGTTLQVLLCIIIPTFALIALNAALIRELKKRSSQPLLLSDEPLNGSTSHRSSESVIQRQERRATITVCAVVCCFIITQCPSGVLMLWNWLGNSYNKLNDRTLFNISRLMNFMVILGKSSNFFVFCFISASFRKRLVLLLHKRKKNSIIFEKFRAFFRHRQLNSSSAIPTKSRSSNEYIARLRLEEVLAPVSI